jgi:ATP-binding cassette subfamily C protein CydD
MRRFSKKSPDPAQARFAQAIAPEAPGITRAAALTVIAGLAWPVMAAAVAITFGRLVEGQATPAMIWAMTGLFLAAGALRIGANHWAAAQLDRAADRILARERAALLMSQDRLAPRAERAPSAATAAMLTDKLPLLRPAILRHRPAALRAAILPIAYLALALPFSWAVALILAVAGPLIPVFMALVGMAAREASERQMDEVGSLSGLLGERLSALTDIRLLDARARMSTEFADRAEALRARTMAVLRVAFLSSTVLELFSAIGVAMVAVYVGFALLGEIPFGAWATPLTLSEGIFLLMLAPEFFQPLRDLAAAWHDKAGALAVTRELAEAEAMQEAEILGSGGASDTAGTAPILALCGLRLGELAFPDLTIHQSEAVAITGPSGSGKSTLLSLIGGLERPDEGDITLDGTPLDASIADAWRARIAWVPQAAQMLAGPLRRALALGRPTRPSDADIDAALALASARDIVARLPGGLDAELGETGGGVSGGEARRLMLARAALSGRPVLLADEPTADLDTTTAAEVIAALLALKARGVTVIVATHDTALAAAMDRQISLAPQALEGAA